MNHYFKDIIDLAGKPLWFDENAVPRYCEFSPAVSSNIYATEAVLLRIACQNCGQRFTVSMTWNRYDFFMSKAPPLSKRIKDGSIHYGDPPNMECCPAGPTMNSEPLLVLQYHRRTMKGDFDWRRVPGLEIEVGDAD